MEENIEAAEVSKEQTRIANEIEAVFERFYKGKKAYSKGQFYKNEFYLRTDYALVVLNKKKDILVSFADHTRPSYAALFTLLLDDIQDTNLFISEDYKTDQQGSMVFDETEGLSTGAIIWDEKERYYSMLREKVQKVVIRKIKRDPDQEKNGE
ncbi:MAG: hypothetical protein JSW15_05440 [Deltaproteobacteria bacterium]|nr:MAG: hypothetical protein JSW15_05440 [Deltaproteobacteria bacterium]